MPSGPVIYLHIGAMKTGTTFLQRLLAVNKHELATEGILFPGEGVRDHIRAGRDILGRTAGDPVLAQKCSGMWDRVTSEMLSYDGRAAVLSMEFLSQASRAKAAEVVDSLTGRGAEVRIILTVRDAVSALPGQWQTHCRNGGLASWPDFVHSAMRLGRPWWWARGEGAQVFALTQDISRMLDAWGGAVPPERLKVVTVPSSGADPLLLWNRVASVLGVDAAVCSRLPADSNTSLGHASADLLRRINVQLGPLPYTDYTPVMTTHLSKKVLSRRAGQEARAELDLPALRFALAWNRRTIRAIRKHSLGVVGSLDDLPTQMTPRMRERAVDRLRDPDDTELMEAAVVAHAGLLRLIARRTEASAGHAQRTHPPVATPEPADIQRWGERSDPVAAAVADLAALVRTAIDIPKRSRAATAVTDRGHT